MSYRLHKIIWHLREPDVLCVGAKMRNFESCALKSMCIFWENVPCLIFPFIFSLCYDSLCAPLRTFFIFSIRLVNFLVLLGTISDWLLNFRILKFSANFRIRVLSLRFFRISIIFFDFVLWCLRGLNSSFFISFLLKYIKTRFSLNKILLQLTGRLFGNCDGFTTGGARVHELKTKTRDEKSCVNRDILLRRRIIPKIESEARLETKSQILISCWEKRINFWRWH